MQVSRRVVAAVVGVMVGMVAAVAAARAQYTVSQTGDIVQLRDETADMTVSVLPDRGGEANRRIIRALRTYQAARAYLLSYDRFEDVPLKGADRTQPPDVDRLLLVREEAPSFSVLLEAFSS